MTSLAVFVGMLGVCLQRSCFVLCFIQMGE